MIAMTASSYTAHQLSKYILHTNSMRREQKRERIENRKGNLNQIRMKQRERRRNPKIRFYFPEKNKNKIEGICEGSHTTEDRIWKLELSMKNRRLASDRLVIG
jgi:hypothetical protein